MAQLEGPGFGKADVQDLHPRSMRTVRAIAEALSDAGVQPEDLEVILDDPNKRLALLIALEHGHGADLGL